ncbi:MAG: nitroreductase family protein [Candidatus Cloacimonetes bacterium]|nr:nitroreductase family protein [Candidatus Cloacimonadota bacterium]
MELLDIIMSRSSVRDFREQEIPETVLEAMMEAARAAPSFQNRQCWRYIFVFESEKIKNLAYKGGLLGIVNSFISKAPLVVVACADPTHSGRVNGQEYYLVDVAISFQQMMLAAWAKGVGSCWLAAFNEKSVKEVLNIPDKFRIVAMSPFGYPASEKSIYSKAVTTFAGSRKRLPREKLFCYNSWNL